MFFQKSGETMAILIIKERIWINDLDKSFVSNKKNIHIPTYTVQLS